MQKWRDYLELCKPRVVALMLLTVVVGMQLASPGFIALKILLFGVLGIALCAGAAATINHLLDQRIDRLMARTRHRPLPSKKIAPRQALYFAIALSCAGAALLIIFVNALTAALTVATLFGYAGLYTVYLKRATPQNIVIGGVAGAMPPLLGWTAVTGYVDPNAWLLVLIIFVWTPPHFWALAIYRCQDYAKADVPMLPVTHGIPFTKLTIFLYTLLLTPVSLLPFATGMSGVLYLIGALLLDAGFIFYVVRLWRSDDNKNALYTFNYSIFYLLILFVVLLVDHFL